MADEKKYSAREAAVAVLKKTEELLKNSELTKAIVHEPSQKIAGKHTNPENKAVQGAATGKKDLKAMIQGGKKLNMDSPKPNLTKDENGVMAQNEQNVTPPDGTQESTNPPPAAPESVNGNPPAGAVPGNGVMKLAYFMGHSHQKRKKKQVPEVK